MNILTVGADEARQANIAKLKHHHRQVKFRYWRRFVSSAAQQSREGKRWIRTKDAQAYYEFAHLSGGRLAFRSGMELACGNFHSSGGPWELVGSREAGVVKFRASVRWHFAHEVTDDARTTKAKAAMRAAVDDEGLLGWYEPEAEATS